MADDLAPDARWTIQLWAGDAIVLSGWLMSADLDQIPVRHKARKQALADLLTALETQVPVASLTQAQIERAQNDISKDMD